jgi:2-dehydropantoate 2-reductase
MSRSVIESIVGAERAVGAVIEVSSAMFEPGVVERHTPPEGSWFALGGRNPVAHEWAARAAEIMRSAGTVEVVDDIESAKWMKLVLNATELATSAIVDLPLSTAFRLPGMLDVVREAGREAARAGIARGHRLVPILGLKDVGTDDPDEYVDTLIDAVLEHYTLPTTLTTILQDWRKGRHSEVDEINGLVAREAERLGGAAPVNRRVNEISLRIERGELEAGVGNLPLLLGS